MTDYTEPSTEPLHRTERGLRLRRTPLFESDQSTMTRKQTQIGAMRMPTMIPLILAVFCATALIGASEKPAIHNKPFTKKERSHWAFQPVQRVRVPVLQNGRRSITPVDAFILQKLQAKTLALRPVAGKRDLIRRAKLDLLGLPPTPEEIDEFLADTRPDAFERLVDRFLASPQYGETWGRLWLDLVRFSETAGFNADPDRPLAYKYRDYVIRSFNENKPYDRFVAEQIAGDELYPDRIEALVATAYNRMWPDESNASDVLLARQDALNDLTANVSNVFLGLSLGCAQCHDHKFDPLLQTDFYRLQAFFAGIVLEDRPPVGSQQQIVAYQKSLNRWMLQSAAVRKELHEMEATAKARAGAIKRRKFPPRVLKAIDTAEEERSALDRQLAFWSVRQIDVKEAEILKKLTKEQRSRRVVLQKQRKDFEKNKPQPPRAVDVMATVELPSGVPDTHLLAGGSYSKPEAKLEPGFLTITVSSPLQPAKIASPRPGTSGRRATLANWLTDPRNPLVARVMVNRIWQGHFGRGLVSNANDFGTRTAPPSHPELLDWLAEEFVRSGWNMKRMHRLMMTSAVYQQASFRRDAADETPREAIVDPGNTLLWHYPRRRMTAERIRDGMLAVSGLLSTKMTGRGIKPKLPPNFSSRHGWKPSPSATDRDRRSVYIYAKRNLPYPLLDVFDFPDMHESCAKRAQTTIAPQALFLLNSDLVLEAAESFADRLLRETSESDTPELIRRAFVLAFAREPSPAEQQAAARFLARQETLVKNSPAETKNKRPPREQAVIDFCHALLNANEFLFVE